MDINIKIENKRAAVIGAPVIVCGNSSYNIAFQFDDEWDEHVIKTARFNYVKEGQLVAEDVVFEGDRCEVPKISNTTLCDVGVYAGDLCTTTPARVACVKSILCAGGNPPDPSPDVYAQIMQILEKHYPLEAARVAEAAAEEAQAAAENANGVRAEIQRGGFVESLKELNHGGKFSFWVGSEEEYKAETNNGQNVKENCFYITEGLAADYFVEFGRYSALVKQAGENVGTITWTYEKRASGIAKCWAHYKQDSVLCDTTWGAHKIQKDPIVAQFPFNFKSVDSCICEGGSNQAIQTARTWSYAETHVNIMVIDLSQTVEARPFECSIEACGWWK